MGWIENTLNDKFVDHFAIAKIWATQSYKNENYIMIGFYEKKIVQAVFDGELLPDEVSVINKYRGGFEVIDNSKKSLYSAKLSWNIDNNSVLILLSQRPFFNWLVETNQWPLDNSFLKNWFGRDKSLSLEFDLESVVVNGRFFNESIPGEVHDIIEPFKIINAPKKTDEWFNVISYVVNMLFEEYNHPPTGYQVWGELWKNPPKMYYITTNKIRGEDALEMPGIKELSRSAFFKRWKRYSPENK